MPVDDAEDLLTKRRSALVAKWVAGKRLSPQEMEEIAGEIDRVKQAAAVLAPAPLRLEAQVEGVSDKKYRKARADYAELYGQSVRTMNRWMAAGAPLDEPALMPAWWSATMKHRVPARLLELAACETTATVSEASGEEAGAAPGQDDATMLSPLEQARTISNAAYTKLQLALKGTDASALALAQRAYQAASEQLRRMELADPKIRSLAGKTVDREKLRVFLTDLHTSIAQSIRSFCKRMRGELRGKSAAEQELAWQQETDGLFARFRSCEFSDPVT